MPYTKRLYSAPTTINLEITDSCNAKCLHCYNFWREDGKKHESMAKERFDALLDLITDCGIFHVVLSGGEPFLNFDLLEYACEKLIQNNISISVNSNLMLADNEKLKRLSSVGVDHILTSINSFDEKTNDYLSQKGGSFKKIICGIESALNNGIRISANMIINQINKGHIYKTGLFANKLGCQKIFGTRTVPPVGHKRNAGQPNFMLDKQDILDVLDQLVRAKQDCGIMIGSLVSYPLCLLGDLDKYRDFVGRGCPAQSGHRMSLNANGASHCCVHEQNKYGNVFEVGIKQVYKNMLKWHNKSYRAAECEGCRYIEICETGCRMSALGCFNSIIAKDPLMTSKNDIVNDVKLIDEEKLKEIIHPKTKYKVTKHLRFRKENGFYLINIRWANTIELNRETAEFLKYSQKTNEPFTLEQFGNDKKTLLTRLLIKEAVCSDEIPVNNIEKLAGLGLDPSKLS